MNNLIGNTLLNRYQIDQFIGSGGMAKVYRAWDSKRAVHVAVKMMNEDLAEDYVFLRRFAQEAHALQRLNHPNIVRFLDFEEATGLAFMVMEFIDGISLRRFLRLWNRPLSAGEALGFLQPISSALHYAHQVGVYHCDIKAANIFLDRNGRVVLGDFGIARLSETATVTFSIPGTPAYMSPEQCHGGMVVDGRADIYSLGIATFEMMTLDRPFKGNRATTEGSLGEKVRWEQINAPPPSPRTFNPQISPAVETVILKALEKKPEDRQQDGLELYEDLKKASGAKPVHLTPGQAERLVDIPIEPTGAGAAAAVPPRTAGSRSAPVGTAPVVAPPAQPAASNVARIGISLFVVALVVVAGLVLVFSGVLGGNGGGNDTNQPGPANENPPVVAVETPPPETATEAPTEEPAEIAPTPAPTDVPVVATEPPLVVEPNDVHVLYVLDVSDSMNQDGKLETARQALFDHLANLQPADNAGLMLYGHRFGPFDADRCTDRNIELPVPIQTNATTEIRDGLAPLSAGLGNSPLELALNSGVDQFTFGSGLQNAMILITDGGDNCGGDPAGRLGIRAEVGQRLPIYILGLNIADAVDRNQLQEIANLSGGAFVEANSPGDLVAQLDNYLGQLH